MSVFNADEIARLRAENARLREALAWYADEANYRNRFGVRNYFIPAGNDNGKRARQALKGGRDE